jgi:hypothetical protein
MRTPCIFYDELGLLAILNVESDGACLDTRVGVVEKEDQLFTHGIDGVG